MVKNKLSKNNAYDAYQTILSRYFWIDLPNLLCPLNESQEITTLLLLRVQFRLLATRWVRLIYSH
jgi:hypothetical protein